ncbi:MAG: Acidobacterial duplicated orphan permease (function unknown) [uncultured Cytophagales bacterium]|uniref:ABC transporter, permease protein n=1 Tax=uncultured Cytophagales bacterium TaxID=158755 RepID=A0A6J4HLV7_9SPHI|nr:MAG: Acidobacterial duplicated orphan permease (function unknown) [uncultured Cytophagales bacterium]
MASNPDKPVRPPGDARPPRWADRLLEWFVAPHLLEYVQGDLHEAFAKRVAQAGAARARREYVRAVLHCLTPFFARPVPKQYPNPTHIDMIRNYFTVARRALLKHRAYSGLNIAGLAVGLTTTMLILLWVKDEVSVDRFHANHDRIYRLVLNLAVSEDKIATYESVTTTIVNVAKSEVPGVAAATRFSFGQTILFSYKGKTIGEYGHQADPDFLKIFSFPLVMGDAATALTVPNTILITQKLADKYFKDEEPLGKIMRIDQKTDVTVVGILADVPSNSTLWFDYLMPFEEPLAGDDNWENNNMQGFLMLDERQARSPSAVAGVNAHLKARLRKHQPEIKDRGYVVSPMRDWYLRWDWQDGQYGGGGRIVYVRLFSIVASFVLLIACINFMNLSTARASQRAKEVGVRKAIGADRRSLVGQFLGESLLLTFIAGLLALGLLFIMLPFFNQLLNKHIVVEYANPRYLAAYAGILLLTSLLAGIYPAFVLSAFQPVKVLKGLPDRTAGGAVWLRQSLVVVQFTVSILLMVGTIVVYQQIDFIRNKNLGYQKENLIIVDTKGLNSQHYEQARRTLEAVPGVQAITAANTNFRGPNWRDFPEWPGKPADKKVLCSIVVGDYDLLPTMGLQLSAGRNFSRSFGRDSVNVIINEEAARLMNLKQPLGHEITFDGRKGNIIGIVRDFNLTSVHSPIEPTLIVCRPENTFLFLVRIDGRQVPNTLASMESAYKSLLPGHPFNYQFADAEYDKMYRSEMQIGTLANCFSLLAIFISCLGLFGLASFTVERRTKEIGVRKVLGASLVSIFGLISREFVFLVVIALVLAIGPAWYLMTSWLDNFAYSVPMQWWVFVLAGVLTIGVALLTVSFQSIKAALMNPAKSLRSE